MFVKSLLRKPANNKKDGLDAWAAYLQSEQEGPFPPFQGICQVMPLTVAAMQELSLLRQQLRDTEYLNLKSIQAAL